jgi:UDP-N-acetylmuramyl tripeptide synthase
MSSVAGRYARRVVGDVDVRLLLSKNPAGWLETFEILEPDASLVLALNARVQDGQDTSWIWDVPFERLAGTKIVCSGERAADIALRLHYAGIEAVVERDLARALQRTATTKVDLVANYTAFQQALSVMPGHA